MLGNSDLEPRLKASAELRCLNGTALQMNSRTVQSVYMQMFKGRPQVSLISPGQTLLSLTDSSLALLQCGIIYAFMTLKS